MRRAESWHFWFRVRRARLTREITKRLAVRNSFLEVGCGTGYLASHLAGQGLRVTGCDLFTGSCENARFRLVRADAVHLPFANRSFRSLGLFDVIEHLDEPENALAEAFRVLEPGGFLFLTVPAMPFLWGTMDEKGGHRRRYLLAGVRKSLADSGFLVCKASYMFPGLVPAIYLRRNRPSYGEDQMSVSRLANILGLAFFFVEDVLLSFIRWPWGISILVIGQKPA